MIARWQQTVAVLTVANMCPVGSNGLHRTTARWQTVAQLYSQYMHSHADHCTAPRHVQKRLRQTTEADGNVGLNLRSASRIRNSVWYQNS